MKYLFFIFSLILLGFAPSLAPSVAHINYSATLTIDGKASHSYTVEFIPRGDTMRRVTSYFDIAKHLVRQETSVYRPTTLKLFSNKIEDFRTGEYLWQTYSGNQIIAQRRERQGERIEQKSMTADNAILSTLVAERIALSMEALDRGETTTFMLALPLHGIMAEMSLVKVQNETINGVSCAVIKLAPSNLLFRVLMGDPSYFFFERAKPYRLIQYKGIVGLPSPEGKQQRGLAQMIY